MPIQALPPGVDLLHLQSADPARFPLLLESVAGGAQSRWDLLLCGDGRGARQSLRKTSVPFVPPKPKPFDIATSMSAWRATFGT